MTYDCHSVPSSGAIGSSFRRASRAGTERRVYFFRSSPGGNSAYRSGVDTVAAETGRKTYGGTVW